MEGVLYMLLSSLIKKPDINLINKTKIITFFVFKIKLLLNAVILKIFLDKYTVYITT